jgi:exoribonuclease-2
MRRYLDLVVQRQLGAALAERELPYNEEELKCLAMKVEPIVRRGFKIRQARQRYWIIKWLAQKKGEAVPGIVMEYQLRRWQVLLTDVMLLTTIPNLPGLSLEPGQEVQLKIDRADPFYDIIKVSLAEPL